MRGGRTARLDCGKPLLNGRDGGGKGFDFPLRIIQRIGRRWDSGLLGRRSIQRGKPLLDQTDGLYFIVFFRLARRNDFYRHFSFLLA